MPAIRTILLDQPLPTEVPTHRPDDVILYGWYEMPSGQIAELRRIVGTHNPEVVVRYVNSDGEMAPGEHHHTLRFLVTRCRFVGRTR